MTTLITGAILILMHSAYVAFVNSTSSRIRDQCAGSDNLEGCLHLLTRVHLP
jgi:hypothetical protein